MHKYCQYRRRRRRLCGGAGGVESEQIISE